MKIGRNLTQRAPAPHVGRRAAYRRRELLRWLAGATAATAFIDISDAACAQPEKGSATLLTGPIELIGQWAADMYPESAHIAVERMRSSCLQNVRLVSDRQPLRIFLDEHTTGTPAIWLHSDPAETAWIIVDVGARDWSRLCYQFGHELGHVLANSWRQDAKPAMPCQWLEEAMVEAFSLRGLALLADGWRQNPPFANDNKFGDAITAYRQDIIQAYARLAGEQGSIRDFAGWFAANRTTIEAQALGAFAQAASLTILAEYEQVPDCVEGLGALNRWPGRSGIPIEQYLQQWQASCRELAASPHLPIRLGQLLGVA